MGKNSVFKFFNYNSKSLPDPNPKYTTMDNFLRYHEFKGKIIKASNSTFNFLENLTTPKQKTICNPTIYSEKTGYINNDNNTSNSSKKENLTIPKLFD